MSIRRLQDSVDLRTLEIKDISKFKFFLFKAEPLDEYIAEIFSLFVNNPDLSDAFLVYLRRFPENEKLIKLLMDLIKNKKFPYQYVEGSAWQKDPKLESQYTQ